MQPSPFYTSRELSHVWGARVAVPGSDTHTCHNTLNTSHDITRRAEHTQGHTVRFFHRPRRVDCSRLFAVTRRCGMGDVSEMSPRCLRESEPAAAARVDETRSDASACNWRAGGGEPDLGEPVIKECQGRSVPSAVPSALAGRRTSHKSQRSSCMRAAIPVTACMRAAIPVTRWVYPCLLSKGGRRRSLPMPI